MHGYAYLYVRLPACRVGEKPCFYGTKAGKREKSRHLPGSKKGNHQMPLKKPSTPAALTAALAAKPGSIRLTDEQHAAVSTLAELEKPVQTLGGYAGTGKTTLIRSLIEQLPNFAVCAFTGKAANVLRRKGVNASTIHSLIYKVVEVVRTFPDGRVVRSTEFRLKNRSDFEFAGIIVDEASMVSRKLYNDLCSFGVPLIFVGDHGQLEPVGDQFNLMASPDIRLETIHRNAGPIAHFAAWLRQGKPAERFPTSQRQANGQSVRILKSIEDGFAEDVPDQIICATNKLRVNLNQIYREVFSFPPNQPAVGDRVMCLQNNAALGVYNGQQGEIAEISPGRPFKFVFATDQQRTWVNSRPTQFNRAQPPQQAEYDQSTLPFDYCYAVTCHKAQGNEWDAVLVVEQRVRLWNHSRWAYTAASRARKRLDWLLV
jgi:exodeoxyribonuclease V